MRQQNVRVMLASEYPEVRSTLKQMVESDGNAIIVGQAENSPKALKLAKNLRPDIAIVDSYLPHNNGWDSLPLSRIGGFDAAQAISEELPNARVVFLNRPEDIALLKRQRRAGVKTFFCVEGKDSCVPFDIGGLDDRTNLSGSLLFTHVETSVEAQSGEGTFLNICNGAMFLGTCGLVLGSLLVITLLLAAPGVLFIALGLASLVFGSAGKLISKMLKK